MRSSNKLTFIEKSYLILITLLDLIEL